MNSEITDFMGRGEFVWFIGVVEDKADPLAIGRVKVRAFGFHPEDTDAVPTKALPWATVLQPTTSAATSGIGWSPTGIENSSWVMGFFADGKNAQYPIVVGTIPRVHRPNAPQNPGNTPGGYTSKEASGGLAGGSGGNGGSNSGGGSSGPSLGGGTPKPPYHGQSMESNPKYSGKTTLPNQAGQGAITGDDGTYLTEKTDPWPLKNISKKELGATNYSEEGWFRVHAASARALDAVFSEVGKGKINSAFRSPGYQARHRIPGRGQHLNGRAFDVVPAGDKAGFLKSCVRHGFTGFGCYGPSVQSSRFFHVDTGGARAWGSNGSGKTAPGDFVKVLESAGWSAGKKPFKQVPTNAGDPNKGTSDSTDLSSSNKNGLKEVIIDGSTQEGNAGNGDTPTGEGTQDGNGTSSGSTGGADEFGGADTQGVTDPADETNIQDPEPAENAGNSGGQADYADQQDSYTPAQNAGNDNSYGNYNLSNNGTTAGVQQQVIDQYRAAGYSDAQISGVLGNIQRESNFNSTLPADDGPGRSGGLFQWNGSRFTGLQNFAAARGTSWTDPETQIAYSIQELNTSESRAGRLLSQAQTPQQAAYAMGNFERFGAGGGYQNPNGSESIARQNAASGFYNSDGTGTGGGDGLGGGGTGTGSNSGTNNQNNNKMPGHHDQSNSLPYGKHQGKPSTHFSAIGDNGGGNIPEQVNKQAGNMGGFPASQKSFGEPLSTRAPKYGFNQVYATKVNHTLEMDDSPGAETIAITHGLTGSKIEMMPGGTMVQKAYGNFYQLASGNQFIGSDGDIYVGSKGDVKIHGTSDVLVQSDGAYHLVNYNDTMHQSSGKYDIMVGDVYQVRAKRMIFHAENIDMYATDSFKVHAEKSIHIKSEKDMAILTKKKLHITCEDHMKMLVKKTLDVHTMEDFQWKTDTDIKWHCTNYNITTEEDMKIKTEAQFEIVSDDDTKIHSSAKIQLHADGDLLTKSDGQTHVKSDSGMFLEATDAMNVKSSGNILVEATADGEFKASGNLKLGGGGTINAVSGVNLVTPDWVSGGEPPEGSSTAQSAEDAEDAEDAEPEDAKPAKDAKSSDLGTPAKRKNINRPQQQGDNPDAGISAESQSYYGSITV